MATAQPALVVAWESLGPNPFAVAYAVRFLRWTSDPSELDGHSWPQGPRDGFSGTEEARQFYLDHGDAPSTGVMRGAAASRGRPSRSGTP